MGWVRTVVLSVGGLCLGALAVHAQDGAWQPPALDRDNHVLSTMTKAWRYSDGRLLVLGWRRANEHNVVASDAFWAAVRESDVEGLIYEAKGTDGVGLSYGPPFVVIFSDNEVADRRGIDASVFLAGWEEVERGIWLHPNDSVKNNRTWFVIFKLDARSGETPGICHARQVITILYTGEADEAALARCLKEKPAE